VEGVYYCSNLQTWRWNCNNYNGISLLSTSYTILSNVLLQRLSLQIYKVVGDHQCGFPCIISTNDQIFCILQILEKKWEQTDTVHQLFTDLRKPLIKLKGKIINQLPLFATYRVFIVHKLHYMFRLYSHPQVYHVYKNAKIIIIT
jgi:hypothetical protein